MDDRDMCGNCGNWRELHYAKGSGYYIGDRTLGCPEYQGGYATPEQRENKAQEVEDGRERAARSLRGE